MFEHITHHMSIGTTNVLLLQETVRSGNIPHHDPQAVSYSVGSHHQQHNEMDKEIQNPAISTTKETGHMLRLFSKSRNLTSY